MQQRGKELVSSFLRFGVEGSQSGGEELIGASDCVGAVELRL